MRIATFNLMSGRSADGRFDPDRLAEAVTTLDVDVLALQEVDVDQPRSGLRDLAAEAAQAMGAVDHRFHATVLGTPGAAWQPADGSTAGPRYGIALLSRIPVLGWSVVELPAAPLSAPVVVPGPRRPGLLVVRDEPRAMVCAVLERDGRRIAVGATHLSFVPGWNVVQARRCVRALRRIHATDRVFVGDLNLPGRGAALATGWHRLADGKTWPAHHPRVQFDHVLSETALRVGTARARELPVSDHRALVVDLPAL